MRIVARPFARPMRCAAMPQVGQTAATRWIDTGSELDGFDNHIYLCEAAVTEAARLFGWVAPGEHRQVTGELATAKGELAAAHKTIAEQARTIGAVRLVHEATTPKPKPKRERAAA